MTRGRFSRTAQAEEDLIEIWSYIAADNARAADRLLGTLDEKSQLLADNPGLGVERPEIAPDVRSWRIGSYLILYREIGMESRSCATFMVHAGCRILFESRSPRRVALLSASHQLSL